MSFIPLSIIRPWLRYLSMWALLFCLVGAIGPTPNYNAAVAIFLLLTSYSESDECVTVLMILLPLSLVVDLLWCTLHGADNSSLGVYGLVMTIFLMILKLPISVLLCALFLELGCEFKCLFKVANKDRKDEQSKYSPRHQSSNSLEQPLNEDGTPPSSSESRV